jgi:hypothetical protein
MKQPADDIESDVLHAVRIKGRASVATAAHLSGRSEPEVRAALDALAARGLLIDRADSFVLTASGVDRHREILEQQREEVAAALESAYRRFFALDVPLKVLLTSWQGLDRNDREGRWEAIEQLAQIDTRAGPPLADAGSVVARFLSYRRRLAGAVSRLRDGDERFFTGVGVNSYHQVWFECHQDFLLTLGLDRVVEGSA